MVKTVHKYLLLYILIFIIQVISSLSLLVFYFKLHLDLSYLIILLVAFNLIIFFVQIFQIFNFILKINQKYTNILQVNKIDPNVTKQLQLNHLLKEMHQPDSDESQVSEIEKENPKFLKKLTNIVDAQREMLNILSHIERINDLFHNSLNFFKDYLGFIGGAFYFYELHKNKYYLKDYYFTPYQCEEIDNFFKKCIILIKSLPFNREHFFYSINELHDYMDEPTKNIFTDNQIKCLLILPIKYIDNYFGYVVFLCQQNMTFDYLNKIIILIEELSIFFEERLRSANLEKKYFQLLEDLEYARRIQVSLLPSSFPSGLSINVTDRYLPSQKVGGDFYQYFLIDQNTLAFYLADVSGHGIAAAMLTVFINQSLQLQDSKTIFDPGKVVTLLNKKFTMQISSEESYCCFFYGLYNIRENKIKFTNAGFPFPVLIKPDNSYTVLKQENYPIGWFEDVSYDTLEIKIEKKDSLYFFSDGIYEQKNEEGRMYGYKRFTELLLKYNHEPLHQIFQIAANHVLKYSNNTSFIDDVTFIAFRV